MLFTEQSMTQVRKLVRKKELKTIYGIPYSPTHIARLEKAGTFPSRIVLGLCRVAWWSDEVEAWMESRLSPLSSFIFLTLRDGKIRTAPLLKINSPQIQRVRFAFAFHRAAVPNRVVYGVMRGDPRATSGPAL